MTVLKVVNGVERAQRLGVQLRYATLKTAEAKVTWQGEGRYSVSIDVPLRDVKPGGFKIREENARRNGFEPELKLRGGKDALPTTGPVEVTVRGNPPMVHVEASFTGDPAELTSKLKELQALDLAFTQPEGMPEFRLGLELAELTLDRTPVARAKGEQAVNEAKADLGRYESDFQHAMNTAPHEAAALTQKRTAAAQEVSAATQEVAAARAAIDELAAEVPATKIAGMLSNLGVPAGKAWRDTYVALATARAALADAEELEKGRAELESAGVDPNELGPAPDLAKARAEVATLEARLSSDEKAVREAVTSHPGSAAHLELASLAGADAARAALEGADRHLSSASAKLDQLMQKSVEHPRSEYTRVIEWAKDEIGRRRAAADGLRPSLSTYDFEDPGSDAAQRALMGVRPGESWEAWTARRHAEAATNPDRFEMPK